MPQEKIVDEPKGNKMKPKPKYKDDKYDLDFKNPNSEENMKIAQ